MTGLRLRVLVGALLFVAGAWRIAFDQGTSLWFIGGLDHFPDLGVALLVPGYLLMTAGPSQGWDGERQTTIFLLTPWSGTAFVAVLSVCVLLLGNVASHHRPTHLCWEHVDAASPWVARGQWLAFLALLSAGAWACRIRKLVESHGRVVMQGWFRTGRVVLEPGDDLVELDEAQRLVVHRRGSRVVLGRLCDDLSGSRTARFPLERNAGLRPAVRSTIDAAGSERDLGWPLGHLGWLVGAVVVLQISVRNTHVGCAVAMAMAMATACAAGALALRHMLRRRAWVRAVTAVAGLVVLREREGSWRGPSHVAASAVLFGVAVGVHLLLPGGSFNVVRLNVSIAVALLASGLGMRALERSQRATSARWVVGAIVDDEIELLWPALLRIRSARPGDVEWSPTPGGEVLVAGAMMICTSAPESAQRFRSELRRLRGEGGYR